MDDQRQQHLGFHQTCFPLLVRHVGAMLGSCWAMVELCGGDVGRVPAMGNFWPKTAKKNTVRSVKANFHAKMVEACGGRLVLCYVVLGPSWGHVGPVAALLRPKNCNPPCKTQCFLITAQLKAKRDHAETFGCQLGPC